MACELGLKLFLKSVGGDRASRREMQWEMAREAHDSKLASRD